MSREKAKLLQHLSEFLASSSKREETLRAEVVGIRCAMREVADSFATKKKNLEEIHIGLSLRVATLSVVPAFPDDPAVIARRCIDATMAVLEVAHMDEGRCFKVLKEGHTKEIYQLLIETLGTRSIHFSPAEDEIL